MTDAPQTRPWERLPNETAAAYRAFQAYLGMEPGRRNLREAYRLQYGCKTAAKKTPAKPPGWFFGWSASFSWVARAEAYDQHELDEQMRGREAARERARQRLIDAASALAEKALQYALGELDGLSMPQAVLLRDALDRAGIIAPKRIETTGKDGGPIRTEGTTRLETGILSRDEARQVAEILATHGALDALLDADEPEAVSEAT